METQRLKITLAYDGAPWLGWQSQPGGRTVQDKLEAALAKVVKQPVAVHGSGRTDAGVHALAQVAHADVPAAITMRNEQWLRALNTHLPPSIRVMHCEPTAPDFHARYQAQGKLYRYRLWRAAEMSPFEQSRAWHVHGALDETALHACLAVLRGTHNFARLSANRGDMTEDERRADIEGTTRTIHRAEAIPQGDVLALEFEGDGFLYKMVRLITGALIRVARGRDSTAWFTDLLHDPTGPKNPHCAPPDGLYLVRVEY